MANSARIFVIGSGGREHALAWHLRRHYPHARLYTAPGNPGIAAIATLLPIAVTDLKGLADAAEAVGADITIVGPEGLLVAGIVDHFQARGLAIIGPTAAAAAIEGSKVFAKQLMRRWGIPTARYEVCADVPSALAVLRHVDGPVVVKADGLAAGKGVVVCEDPEEASRTVRAILVDRIFGDAGKQVVIEDRLEGTEVSVFALLDGEAVALLPAAQDHKRLGEGDRGPNTGGMGAVAPYPLDDALRARIVRDILEPVARALCAEGRPYRGVLFAGLMLTRDGPMVLEFNCRLGDPEAQVILPLASLDLVEAFERLRTGDLGVDTLAVAEGAAVGVVLAAGGYPGPPMVGDPIEGLGAAEDAAGDVLVFHGGTALREGRLVTAGGRVLTVVGRGATLQEARGRAYRAVDRIRFAGMQYRRDIGAKAAAAASSAGGRG
jgi:phosphoribosylamine--glycine ligase